MANGKIKTGNANVKTKVAARKTATGNGTQRRGSKPPATVKAPAQKTRRDAAGKF